MEAAQKGQAGDGQRSSEPDLEDYDYPGRFTDRARGKHLSQRSLERHRADAKQASTQQISTHTVETTSQETTQILERLDHLLNKNTEKSSSWPEFPVSLQSTTIALLVASACVASMLFLLLIAGCCYRNYQNSPEAFHDILDHAIRGMRRRQAGDAQEADRMAQLRAAQFQPPGTGGDAGPRIFAPTSGGRMVMGAGI